jgi:hypothetical protein
MSDRIFWPFFGALVATSTAICLTVSIASLAIAIR